MVIELGDACRVIDLREGRPLDRPGARIWRHVGRRTGAQAVSLRVIEVEPGARTAFAPVTTGDLLYVFEGEGRIAIDGVSRVLRPDSGFHLAPGQRLSLENLGPQPLVLLGSQVPEAKTSPRAAEPEFSRVAAAGEPFPAVHLWEREAQTAAGRWYRVLADESLGSHAATQFVVAVPVGRGPDHAHDYEKVLCVLMGSGTLWAGDRSAELARGSCIYLPPNQVHAVENTGAGEMRLLGVRQPAGPPADRTTMD